MSITTVRLQPPNSAKVGFPLPIVLSLRYIRNHCILRNTDIIHTLRINLQFIHSQKITCLLECLQLCISSISELTVRPWENLKAQDLESHCETARVERPGLPYTEAPSHCPCLWCCAFTTSKWKSIHYTHLSCSPPRSVTRYDQR